MIDIDLMIFDVDGTLIDSRKDIVKAVKFTLKKMDLKDKPFDEIVSYIGKGIGELLRRSIGEGHIDLLDKSLSIFGDYYREHSTDETRPYPNIIEILEYFKDKTKVVVTNRTQEFAKLTLGLLGIDKYFSEIIGGDDRTCIKPMARPLNNILEKFNMDKKKTIMIGDMDLDIFSGKSAGVYTCAVTYGIGKKDDIQKAKPDYIIDDLLQLKNIIK